MPNRFTVVGTQAFKTGPLSHNVGLVFTAQAGQPYSILMGGDPNKDGGSSNDLIFVPQNYSDVVWKGAGAPTEDKWNNFLGTTGLDKYRGQILPRNALDAPWLHTLDFHYDVTLPISVVNVQLSFEILNLINLIDRNHGLVRYVQNQTYTPLNYSGIDATTEGCMGLEPNYIVIDGQTFSKVKLALDNHVYKNCQIDDCDLYYSGGQYELLDTHVTNSRLVFNHPAKGIYNAVQIFKMKSPSSKIIFE